jgi:hypothetical protein
VRAALALLLVLAGLWLVVIGLTGYDLAHWGDHVRAAGAGLGSTKADIEKEISTNNQLDWVTLLMSGSYLASSLIMAVRAAGPHHLARVLAAVVAGLQATCCTAVLGLNAALGALADSVGADTSQPLTDASARVAAASEPAWVGAASNICQYAIPVVAIAALALFVVPPSNRYYRAGDPAWSSWPTPPA